MERRHGGATRVRGERRSPAPSLGYRPGLDGVRAAAVVAVVGYHTGVLRSGWIGVDVFFALSGYLITGLLVAELDAFGRIGLGGFWARRARRLVPALLLLLGFVVVLGLLGLPGWTAPQLTEVLGAITYTSNWVRVAHQQSYWDLFRQPGPLDHVWSLAIEEQFYVVWPVVVVVVARIRRSLVGPAAVLLLLVTAALQVGLPLFGAANERLYVGTDTRAPAFLLGAVLVMYADRRGAPARWATYGLPVGLAWLAAACVWIDGQSIWTYRGLLLAVSVLGAFTVLAAARLPQDTPVAAFLASVPLQQLGRWSYGIYLFHWPVAVALRDQEMLGVQRFVLVGGISLALAAASYELLEHPIRRHGVPVRLRLPALAGGAAILLAACGTVSPEQGRTLDAATRIELLTPLGAPGGASPTMTAPATTLPATTVIPATAIPTTTTGPATTLTPTTTLPATTTTALVGPIVAVPENGVAANPTGHRLVVIGDSVPFQLDESTDPALGLTAMASARGIEAAVRAAPGCTPSTDARDHYRNDTRDICAAIQSSISGDLAAFAPDALLVYYGLSSPDVYQAGVKLSVCSQEGHDALTAQLTRLIDLGTQAGAMVYLVPPADPPLLDWMNVDAQAQGADCYRAVYTELATARPATTRLLRVDEFVCPTDLHECDGTRDGVQLRYDGIHFNPDGERLVLPWILERIYLTS